MRLRGRDILKTSKGGISLPNYGTSDKEYLQGPTGKWYSKIEARKKSDVNLATWIDRKYYKDNVWPVERIVDHRKDSDGKVLYLIKFLGYELNPGVINDESNEGDWYVEDDGITDEMKAEYFRKKRKSAVKVELGKRKRSKS